MYQPPTRSKSKMEPYELVETFQQEWPRKPKGVPLETVGARGASFGLFLQAGDLQVHISLLVGVKGGITETVVVVDPKPRVIADRLVVYSTDGGDAGRGMFLPLSDLRRQVAQTAVQQKREVAIDLCRRAMLDYVNGDLKRNPLRPEQLRLLPSTSQSIRRVIFSGAPSLGKGGGGAPGRS